MSDNLRPAATILLIRDGADGLEVFMVKRHRQIDFAGSALVFPGGRVDEHDRSASLKEVCVGYDDPDGDDGDESFIFRVASIREAFEETGILLAKQKGATDFISREHAFSLWDYRERIEKREILFEEFLRENDLQADCSGLTFYAHWITPEMMPKRFDTYFYIAVAPEGQAGLHDGREMVDSLWIRPKDAIADGQNGEREIIFPTMMNLAIIAKCKDVAQAIEEAQARKVVTVLPKLDKDKEKHILRIPKEAGYPLAFETLSGKTK